MALPQNIAILILAAGASSRMGRTKQLLPWENTTLLGNAIRNAKASDAGCVTIVLGANAEAIRKKSLQVGIEIIKNTEWKSGLGSSIACGAKFLSKKYPETKGILVMLADQPLIDSSYLQEMMGTFDSDGKTIISTAYKDRAGVPALFPESCFEKLATLDDDFGAKSIINGPNEKVLILDPGRKTLDVDTISDYENLINIYT